MGDRRRGTVDRRKETGEGGQEMGDRKGTGDKKGERVLTSFPKNFAGQFTNF